jgi:hypothetical protein
MTNARTADGPAAACWVGRRRLLNAAAASSPRSGSGGIELWTVAVRADGRRAIDAAVLDAAVLEGAHAAGAILCLDHAGPRAATWSVERPIGPSAVAEAETGRRPCPLDVTGWDDVRGAFAAAAVLCREAGVAYAIAFDDDGLWHATLSPRTNPRATDAERLDTVLRTYAACAAGGVGPAVILPVEDLAPGGLDVTDGLTLTQALVGQGAPRVFAAAGTAALPALKHRRKGRSRGDLAASLGGAGWLAGQASVPVVAVVPEGALPWEPGALGADRHEHLERTARRMGLAGIVVDAAPVSAP